MNVKYSRGCKSVNNVCNNMAHCSQIFKAWKVIQMGRERERDGE